ARNMQNYPLLEAVGESGMPVLLKRGPSATMDEFLLAAEYILKTGNTQVMLCERGIRTFEDHTRFTLPLATVPYLQQTTHLPVVVDPSHGTGKASLVATMARAAVAAGADGLMVEIHPDPEKALSDGFQALTPAACGPMTVAFHPPGEEHSEHFRGEESRSFNVEVAPAWLQRVREVSPVLDRPADFQGGALAFLAVKLYREFQEADAVAPLAVEGL